jgi:methionyl-tRNA synthetase
MVKTIDFKNWEKLDLRVGEIEKIEDIKKADKLYKLIVNIGSENRTIIAGIKQHYSKEELKGMKIIIISNLKPKKVKGITSQGMLLAAENQEQSKIILLTPESEIEPGSKIK